MARGGAILAAMSLLRSPSVGALLVAIGAFFQGCGGKTDSEVATDSGTPTVDSGVDAPLPDVRPDTIEEAACTKAATPISKLLTAGYCTTLVRLSTIDLSVRGWTVDCGPLEVATEAEAREVFRPYAGEYSPVESYLSVGPTGGTDDWVFYHSPGDFGGLGIVARATSHLVFAGALSWSALGSVRQPTTFHSAAEAPSVCAPRSITEYTPLNPGGGAVDAAEIARVLLALDATPVRRGIEGAGHAIVHTLLVYFPVDGAPESGPPKNEWLVVMDSGLLD
jgi:hypothetical protein